MSARSVPIIKTMDVSTANALWCSILLEDLDELITLAWTMLADERLVEESFARTMTHLEATACDRTAPWPARGQVRSIFVTQAIAVSEPTSSEAEEKSDPSTRWALRAA